MILTNVLIPLGTPSVMALVIRPEPSAPKKMAMIANLPHIMSPVQGVVTEAALVVEVVSSDNVEVAGTVSLAGEATTPRVLEWGKARRSSSHTDGFRGPHRSCPQDGE